MNFSPSLEVALAPDTRLFKPVLVDVGALSMEQIVLEIAFVHIATWVLPDTIAVRKIAIESTYVAFFSFRPRSLTTLLVHRPTPSV